MSFHLEGVLGLHLLLTTLFFSIKIVLMSTNRSLVFANDQIYHVFNRGIERRTVFTNTREYQRMLEAVWFYRFRNPKLRLSHYLNLSEAEKRLFTNELKNQALMTDLIAFCLMPNHFHLVLRQKQDNGIRSYVANTVNSYTKYFNIKHKRVGPLFQGIFKAVHVETEEQLLHLTRYVHLNPVTAYLVEMKDMETYPWSSLAAYLNNQNQKTIFVERKVLKDLGIPLRRYLEFVSDQAGYACDLNKIKHISFDEEGK